MDGLRKMKKRIAVYTPVHHNWGGAFQYVEAVIIALAGLPRDSYDVRVWHRDDNWSRLLKKFDVPCMNITEYMIPEQFRENITGLLQLHEEQKNSAQQTQELKILLNRFSNSSRLSEYAPHVMVLPQMAFPNAVPGARHVCVIHDLMHKYEKSFPEVGTPEEQRARDIQFNAILKTGDIVLVDSEVGAKHVLECYPHADKSKIRVLPYTAFEDIVKCIPQKPAGNFPEKFFFYPAQFWKHKNHAGLARAIARLRKDIPDIHVVAAGNTKQNGFDDFMKIVNACGLEDAFSLPGYVATEELAWFYKHARALVMPTFFGPTNIPPLEAMALGCPVAVSGIYGMPERYGDAALYFNPADIGELAGIIRRIWTDDALCAVLREKGKRCAEQWGFTDFYGAMRAIVEELACGLSQRAGSGA
ncbi:MAG: glycosyltransferase family 4 protein [Desulfovibrio sp.]|jgi:glycosyltransferase involved in cell wall biosynthesis|nr:glycosyltransferase family 4 protein [Desulfovibrio sp.]